MNLTSIVLCIFTDLHFSPGSDYSFVNRSIERCDMLVFVGDILNFDAVQGCPNSDECQKAIQYLDNFVTDLKKPYLFTLGNHDSTSGENKLLANNILGNHELHRGNCNVGYTACVHPELKIAMLYSGDYYCPSGSYWGCHSVSDATYINDNLDEAYLLFTHIPPPAANYVTFIGIKGETAPACSSLTKTCTWKEIDGVLPSISVNFHLYGHDHDNLYIGQNTNSKTQYVSLLKSGYNSYGPCFTDQKPGYTVIDQNQISFRLFNSTTLDINNIPNTGCEEARKENEPNEPNEPSSQLLGIIIGLSVLFVLIVGIVIYNSCAGKSTKTLKYVPLKKNNLIF